MTSRLLPAVCLTLALGATACGVDSDEATRRALPPLTRPPTTTAPATTTTTTPECGETASYPALPSVPNPAEAKAADPFIAAILERPSGKLVVAVDENTKYLAARNPTTGNLEGTEIGIAKRIAQEIFGGEIGEHVQFKTVTTKEKIEFPRDGKADLAISAISMTCERWEDVAFSSEYLATRHKYLVQGESTIASKDDVAGKRVCVTKGSTSIGILDRANAAFRQQGRKPATIVPVDARTDCLLQVQEGTVDAYLGHDTFLTGMLEQNRALRVVDEGTLQHYGIAIAPEHTYFVQYVNAVLAELRAEGESLPPGSTIPLVDETRPLP
jgi:polar amino acid transport system substrate-binding protein